MVPSNRKWLRIAKSQPTYNLDRMVYWAMLSVDRVRRLLNNPKLTDDELEEIKDDLRMLAEIVFETLSEERKKEKDSDTTR